ncbi:unnamed protein product [Rotaria sordida]|uniref:Uncharacterized protein n=1 Tax=Rotaria sordida TaxID=392033 RepID=A0A819PAX9_9BILA|nr:unnamed protein product [Rotaria sordida]CAF4013787.1 unnamed protein product [Rotaria sordida]
MSQHNKKTNYLILSSDSETSNHENEHTIMQQTSRNRHQTYSSKQIRKRARSFIEYEAEEDYQLDEQFASSSELTHANASNSNTSNVAEINSKNSKNVENINSISTHIEDDNTVQEPNMNNQQTTETIIENNSLFEEDNDNELIPTTTNISSNIANNSSVTHIQTSINRYFSSSDNSFQSIDNLTENMSNFRIRGKIIYISPIRFFGTNGKVFDAIVCDLDGEIKIAAFNEEVDRLYGCMFLNQAITIENGQIQKADERYRTSYSMYEIRLLPTSNIQPYQSAGFSPNIKITKTEIRYISQSLHGTNVGIAHWCFRTVLNIDMDWDIPLLFFGVIIGYPGSNKSTAINLIERATREVEQAFDEFNTFASSFSLYRADKAAYHRSVLNTLWNGPKCYFRQLVKGDVKCENPWLSIVAAAHPGAIMNILKEENNQLGADGLFARFIFSARMSPEDVHKRAKRETDTVTGEYNLQSCSYPSLTHIMYFIYLMHHNELLTLKISQAANEILMRTHDEYNNMVIGFQGYQDILCTLFSKSRDHLYRICGLLHLLHQACSYVLKVEPQLQYLVFDDIAAESIQKMATLAQRNIDEYLTISPDIAQTTVELMKFYVDTKKLLYGFPLITIPPSEEINIGPSISQQIHTTEQNTELNNPVSNIVNMDNQSVLSNYSGFSNLSSSICPFNGSTVDASIKKILFYHNRVISSTRLAQILRKRQSSQPMTPPLQVVTQPLQTVTPPLQAATNNKFETFAF